MVNEWKEQEHSEEDEEAMGNVKCMEALRDYRLKKLFMAPCLRAQTELLQYLISVSNIDQENFIIHDQELETEVSDIFLITGLSWRGAVPILINTQPTMENMSMVIDRVCLRARKGSNSGKVDIQTIPDLALKVVLHTITQAVGSQAPHEAMKTKLLLVVYCMASTLCNWSEVVTINMKCQLTKCKNKKLN